MGKSYRRNDEYGNKYRGARKSNKKIDKNRKPRNAGSYDETYSESFKNSYDTWTEI